MTEEYAYGSVPDIDMPAMTKKDAAALLKNPNRGFRGETYITLGEKPCAYPKGGEDPYERAERLIKKYEPDSPTVFQAYVYLCSYAGRQLDELAFSQLEKFFELFKSAGIRLLLRFAYSTESEPDVPYETVKVHLQQLKKWFDDHENLISDVIYCMQTGIIGYWGEGHSYKKFRPRHTGDVIGEVCRLVPDEIYSQVRNYKMFKKTPPEYRARVGLHDDYITGDASHKWAYARANRKRAYQSALSHAAFTVNDGEMPWGRAYTDDKVSKGHCDNLDGRAVLAQAAAYRFTTFSLEHNYREDEGRLYSMMRWRDEPLCFDECKRLGIHANPNLFFDASGEPTEMSVFETLQYHLGYQLAVSGLCATAHELFFGVTNYGFAAPLTFNYFACVFRDENGNEKEIPFEKYNKNALLSGTTVTFRTDIPHGLAPVGLKLETHRGSGICARFANKGLFENGVHYFTQL